MRNTLQKTIFITLFALSISLYLAAKTQNFTEQHSSNKEETPLEGSKGILFCLYDDHYYRYPNTIWTLPVWPYNEDGDGDGVPWTKVDMKMHDKSEHEWFTGDLNYFVNPLLRPDLHQTTQGEKVVRANTWSSNVGDEYRFQVGSISERIGMTVVATYTATRYIHLIAYPIDDFTVENQNGTKRDVTISWNTPVFDNCDIEYYNVFRSTDSIASTNYREATILETNIQNRLLEYTDTTNVLPTNYNYAIGGYETSGRLIALSDYVIPTFETTTFSLISPTDNNVITSQPTSFTWESIDNATYELLLSESSDYSDSLVYSGITDTTYSVNGLTDNTHYYWKVHAIQAKGYTTISAQTQWRFGLNTTNSAPSSFSITQPTDGSTLLTSIPYFTWNHAADPGDNVYYKVIIGYDALFYSMSIYDSLTQNYLYVTSELPQNVPIYLKIIAFDSQSDSTLNSEGSIQFTYDKDDSPAKFSKIFPHRHCIDGDVGGLYDIQEVSSQPTFSWYSSTDLDNNPLSYHIMIDTSYTFDNAETYTVSDTSWTYTGTFDENEEYYWDVYAVDADGDSTKSYGLTWSFCVNETNEPPEQFNLISPSGLQDSLNITFSWEEANDPDPNGTPVYDFYLSGDSLFTSPIIKQRSHESYSYTFGYSNPQWLRTDFNAFQDSAWYCGSNDTHEYGNGWLQALKSIKVFIPSSKTSYTLSFKHKYDTEPPDWDGGAVLVSNNDELDWEVLYPTVGSYDTDSLWAFTYNLQPKMPGYCGNSGGWIDASFDLTPYAGDTIQVKFLFASDQYECDYEGWHIDNIEITSNRDQLLYDDGLAANQSFEGFSDRIQRGKTYFWKVKARDRFSCDDSDYVFTDYHSFKIKKYPSLSGYAYLENQTEHDSIKVVLIPQSPYADRDSTYTNSDGYYIFNNIYPGTYKTNFSKLGYESPPNTENFFVYPYDLTLETQYLCEGFYPPSNLSYEAGNERVDIFWDSPNSSLITNFIIYRKSDSVKNYNTIDTTLATDTSYIDTTVSNDIQYYYKLSSLYYNIYQSALSSEISMKPWYSGSCTYVSTNGVDEYGNGSENNPLRTVQQAAYFIANGDTIIIEPGEYDESIDMIGKYGHLTSIYNFSSLDTNYINTTILSGIDSDPVIIFNSPSDSFSTLSGLSINNSFEVGIFCDNSKLITEKVKIFECEGNGFNAYGSNIIIEDSKIFNNNSTNISLENSEIDLNYVDVYNKLYDYIGGISLSYCTGSITNCRIHDNEAHQEGGGISMYGTNIVLENNLFFNNYAGQRGAAIKFNHSSGTIVRNCTFHGHGKYSYQEVFYFRYSSNLLENCIIYGNVGETVAFYKNDSNPVFNYSIIEDAYNQSWLGTGCMNIDPLFTDPENNDFTLTINSPCIDTGNPDSLFYDPDNSKSDMGALYFDHEGYTLPPIIYFEADSTTGYAPLLISFTDSTIARSGDIIEWNWNFGDGTDSTYYSYKDTIIHNYETGGTFDVTLTLKDEFDSTFAKTKNHYIQVTTPFSGGNISGIMTYDSSPYLINGDLFVPNGEVLEIELGVTLIFNGHYKFDIYGTIIAIGTEQDSIKFTAVDHDAGWFGLRFDNTSTSNDSSKFEYCIFEYSKANENWGTSDAMGGAIYVNNYSEISISKCLFVNNYAWHRGGGISIVSSNPVIDKNQFYNNSSRYGGAVYTSGSNSSFVNNIYCNNNAARGGALYLSLSSITLTNDVICNNKGTWSDPGAGIRLNCSNINAINSVLWGNSDSNNTINPISNNDSFVNIAYSNIEGGWTGEGNIDSDPLFINPSDGAGISYSGYAADWSLQDDSPCIDAGTPDTTGLNLSSYDLAGNPRIVNGRIDMGAYEYQPDAAYATMSVLLEGNYDTNSNCMTTTCSIPTTSPYTGQDIGSLPTIDGRQIIDWILIRLKSTQTGSCVDSTDSFLLDNGSIVDVNGNYSLPLNSVWRSNFYIEIHHRNHIDIISEIAHSFGNSQSNTTTINLTQPGSIHGNGCKELESGIFGMYAGDINGDGEVTTADYTSWFNSFIAGTSGYENMDLNLDGEVTTADYTKWFNAFIDGASCSIPEPTKKKPNNKIIKFILNDPNKTMLKERK